MKTYNQEYLLLNSSYKIPQIGLGTWQCPPQQAESTIAAALQMGYRHFDCAAIYGNEPEIGQAFGKIFSADKVTRNDVFVTSKIFNTFHSYNQASMAVEQTLRDLQLSYLDLCLIHWPMGYKEGGEPFPKGEDGKILYSDVDYLETWKALENAVRSGKVKSIGLSNFNKTQIQRIMDNCTIKPANLQIESHPYFNQTDLINWSKEKGIVVSCYSPLSSPTNMFRKPDDPTLFNEPVLKKLAEKYSKSVSEIILRWHVQRGVVALPKSTKPEHMLENFSIWDFVLSNEDADLVNGMNKNWRIITLDRDINHPHYPFK